MAFSIKSDEADDLLRELTAITGESLTACVTESLRERLERETRAQTSERARRRASMERIVDEFNRLPPPTGPIVDDDFLYDERGLPH